MNGQVLEREYSAYGYNLEAWAAPKPAGISGCFRVRNDAQFLRASVLSHLPYLDEAVIALQPSEDDTEAVCEALAREYPEKVRICRYPVAPEFITSPRWHETPEDSICSFVHLSNWALSQCRYQWISKSEADVIALPGQFAALCERVRNSITPCYYGRVILNVAGEACDRVSVENPRNAGWDEAIFPNHPAWYFIKRDRWETVNFWPMPHECAGWSAWHMKRCKSGMVGWNGEHYVPRTREAVRPALEAYSARYAYPAQDDPYGPGELYGVIPFVEGE